jgi:hypothetical protein
MKRVAAFALLTALATAARGAESPRWGSFELGAGTYLPDIDSEFPPSSGPYAATLGGRGWMFRIGAAKAIFSHMPVGSLEVGLQSGYFQKKGEGLNPDGSRSGDETALKMIPVSAVLTYRFDWLADRYRIPFAPYGRVGLERFHWWVTDGDGGRAESGATNGWSMTGGLAFLLDVVDSQLARELDNDTGVNHTYLFFEVTKRTVDDFGSSKSWDMSDANVGYSGGLLFVF